MAPNTRCSSFFRRVFLYFFFFFFNSLWTHLVRAREKTTLTVCIQNEDKVNWKRFGSLQWRSLHCVWSKSSTRSMCNRPIEWNTNARFVFVVERTALDTEHSGIHAQAHTDTGGQKVWAQNRMDAEERRKQHAFWVENKSLVGYACMCVLVAIHRRELLENGSSHP